MVHTTRADKYSWKNIDKFIYRLYLRYVSAQSTQEKMFYF